MAGTSRTGLTLKILRIASLMGFVAFSTFSSQSLVGLDGQSSLLQITKRMQTR